MALTIKAVRVNAGHSQKGLAELLGVSDRTIASWEQGKTIPNVYYAHRISEICDVNFDDIKWF